MKREDTRNGQQCNFRPSGHGWLANWTWTNLLLLASTLICSGEDFTTTIIDGVTSNHTFGAYYVGASGAGNFLMITNGGQLESSQSFIGPGTNAHENLAIVTGQGSTWNAGRLEVGFYGSSNILQILAGGRVNAHPMSIGVYFGAKHNHIFVSGAGSQLDGGACWFGVTGTETELVIQDGGQANFGDLQMSAQGYAPDWGNGNRILVTGTNSFLSAGRIIFPATGISNRLTVLNGARVSSGWSYMISGRFCDVLVSGPGSSWTNSSLEIHSGTSNHITIADGAVLDTKKFNTRGSRNGEFRVVGPGSILNLQSNSPMEFYGSSNRLTISAGASANLPGLIIGGESGNALSVEGPNTLFTLPSDLNIDSASGSNSVTITGENTRFLLASNLVMGSTSGGNAIEISAGAWMTNQRTLIASNSSGNTVSITGPGSWWNMGSNFVLGVQGTNNQLRISDGATLTNGSATFGTEGLVRFLPSPNGSTSEVRVADTRVTVSGAGSHWETRGPLFLGVRSGGNIMNITDGAEVTAMDFYVGYGSPLVSGEAQALSLAPNVLRVSNGSRLSVTKPEPGGGYLRLLYGTLQLTNGVIEADWLWAENTAQDFEFSSGDCRLKRLWTLMAKPLVIGDGQHAARLTLTGSSHRSSSGIKVSPAATLVFGGTVNGSIENAGTVRPEYAGYASVISGDFVLRDTGRLLFSLRGVTPGIEYSSLRISRLIQCDGTLQVSLAPGYVPAATNQFVLLQYASRTGEFLNVTNGSRLTTTDGLGSFRVQITQTNLVLTDFASTDLDGDGIADAWAQQHFGQSPLSPATLNADADGDGTSNRAEFQAGTDPHSAASVFRLTILSRNHAPVLRFTAVDTRQYRLWTSADLVTWTEVPSPLFEPSDPGWLEWRAISPPAPSSHARYYRVMVQ